MLGHCVSLGKPAIRDIQKVRRKKHRRFTPKAVELSQWTSHRKVSCILIAAYHTCLWVKEHPLGYARFHVTWCKHWRRNPLTWEIGFLQCWRCYSIHQLNNVFKFIPSDWNIFLVPYKSSCMGSEHACYGSFVGSHLVSCQFAHWCWFWPAGVYRRPWATKGQGQLSSHDRSLGPPWRLDVMCLLLSSYGPLLSKCPQTDSLFGWPSL